MRFAETFSRGRPATRRGSALLMVIGLLTVLAMLGATLLVISHLVARQSRTLAVKAQADPVAEGILSRIVAVIAEDLHCGGGGGAAFSGTDLNATGWLQFIDSTSVDNETLDADRYLASVVRDSTGRWPRITNLGPANNAAGVFTNVDPGDPNLMIDTDGDGVRDARWFNTGVTDRHGDSYYSAVRVIDLSGMLCVNTAGDPAAANLPQTTRPVSIDLKGLFQLQDPNLYDGLHDERRAGEPNLLPLDSYSTATAERLLQAQAGLPFAIGDEMYLRWRAPHALSETGRLFSVPDPNLALWDRRAMLTTYNCSRVLARRPTDPNDGAIFPYVYDPNDPGNTTAGQGYRQRTYEQMLGFLELWIPDTDEEVRKHAAAAFVANLWAYQSDSSDPFGPPPYAFEPDGETFTAYGMAEPELVITEAYAKGVNDPNGDLENEIHAIELLNVSDQPVNLTDTQYRLLIYKTDGSIDEIKLWDYVASITDETTHVFYSIIADDNAFFNPADITGNYDKVNGLNFDEGETERVFLFRGDVVIDDVRLDELNYTPPASADANTLSQTDLRRDNNIADHRYLVAKGFVVDPNHHLGSDNELTPNDPNVSFAAVFPVRVQLSEGRLTDVGEMAEVFFCGPSVDPTDPNGAIPFTRAICDDTFKDYFRDNTNRGRLNFHDPDDPNSVGDGGWDVGLPPKTYPDVPVAALLGEFFTLVPPDPTRSDDARRIYGRININTAPWEVLRQLPWPTEFTLDINGDDDTDDPGETFSVEPNDAVDYIIAYRDRKLSPGDVYDYAAGRSVATGIANLRSAQDAAGVDISNCDGYLTAGEAAIPLADYANEVMIGALTLDQLRQLPDYAAARDGMYRAVSNLITTRSDTFAANIIVQLRDAKTPGRVKYTWRYVAVIDRSNCGSSGDTPAVILFSEAR